MKVKKNILTALAAVTAGGLILSAVFSFTDTARSSVSETKSVQRRYLASGSEYVQNGLIFTELEDGTYEIGYNTASSKPSGTVVIPDKVNGRRVTRIAEAGFYNCDKLTNVVVPDSVTSAGANAFAGTPFLNGQSGPVKYAGKVAVYCASNAKNVTVKDGTLGLADRLFTLAEDLKTVSLPDSLINLGSMTFAECTKLTSVNIPSGVTVIGSGVFNNCASLSSVSVPSGVTAVGSYAFANSGITSADLSNVTEIGKGAFEGSKLGADSVKSGSGYVDIGARAFADTAFYSALGNEKYLGSVLIGCGKDIESVTVRDGTTAIADMAFSSCKALKSVTIPGSVKTIGEDAFFNCPKLRSVEIPEGVESIGEDAFRLCAGLTSVSLPKSLRSAEEGAFYGCDSVESVSYPGSVSDMAKIEGGDGFSLPCADMVKLGEEPKTVSPVSGLTVSSVSYDSVTLSWKKPELATGFRVEVRKNGRWSFAGWTDTDSYTVTGLEQCGSYDFRVYACVHSVLSTAATASAQTKLGPVTGIKTEPDANEITLSWDKNDCADSYQIDIFKNDKWTYVMDTADTSCTVTGLTTKSEYLFRIYSFRGGEHSTPATAVATASDPNELKSVKDLKAVPSSDSVELSWSKSALADSYQIDVLKDGKWTYVDKITDTSYTVTELSPETSYQFRVFAFRDSKFSPSASVGTTTKAAGSDKPSAVTGLTASPSSDSITLSWNGSAAADSYQVDMYRDGEWVYVAKISDTSYTVTGLFANTGYQFRVFAFKGSEYSSSARINASTGSASSGSKPAAVTGLSAYASSDSITLSWNGSASADSYQIDIMKNGKWTYAAKTTGTSYTVTRLAENTSYSFRVYAFRGSQYSPSTAINASTVSAASGKPSAVTGLGSSSTSDSVTLSWSRSAAADSYRIDMYKDGSWTNVTETTDTSFTVTGLSADSSYDFRVYALKGEQLSPSAELTASTKADTGRPGAVTGLAAMSGMDSISLYWNRSADADSYQVDMYQSGKWVYAAKITGTSYTIKDLYADTEYKFRVYAFRGSQYSPSESITASTSLGAGSWGKPAAVTGLSASRGNGSITLSWNSSTFADSYQVDMLKDGSWTYVAKSAETSCTVTGLDADTSYEFRVFALKDDLFSASTGITVSTPTVLAPTGYVLAPPDNGATALSGERTLLRGIDVSGWQGTIDFNAVKESGVDYVIIKAGGSYSTVPTWEINYENARRAGLKVGAYWYSYAVTLEEGRQEAKAFIEAMKGKQFDFPVYFDIEESDQFAKGASFCTTLIDTFCTALESSGYYAGVYCSTNWFRNSVGEDVRAKRPAWIADYRGGCYYDGAYGAWQYGAGEVDGVEFDADLNWGYFDYSRFIRSSKLNGF